MLQQHLNAAATPPQVFQNLGLDPTRHLVVLMYGGHQAGAVHLAPDTLPPGWACVVCGGGAPPANLPEGFVLAPADTYTPDLVCMRDCMLQTWRTHAGCGGRLRAGQNRLRDGQRVPGAFDAAGVRTPRVLQRGACRVCYMECQAILQEPFLRRLLHHHRAGIEIKRRDFVSGTWGPCLERALQLTVHYPHVCLCLSTCHHVLFTVHVAVCRCPCTTTVHGDDQQATDGAAHIAQLVTSVAWGDTCLDPVGAGAGTTRLRDTVVWGYVMQR